MLPVAGVWNWHVSHRRLPQPTAHRQAVARPRDLESCVICLVAPNASHTSQNQKFLVLQLSFRFADHSRGTQEPLLPLLAWSRQIDRSSHAYLTWHCICHSPGTKNSTDPDYNELFLDKHGTTGSSSYTQAQHLSSPIDSTQAVRPPHLSCTCCI